MNNIRRQQLKEIIKHINKIKIKLEDIESDEEISFDNMPEGLKSTLNGINSEEAIDKMNEAIICFEDAIEVLETII